MKLFLIAALATVIGISASSAAPITGIPRPKTLPALACLIGRGPRDCQAMFEDKRIAWRNTSFCSIEFLHRRRDLLFRAIGVGQLSGHQCRRVRTL
jgi:hypothetical protein